MDLFYIRVSLLVLAILCTIALLINIVQHIPTFMLFILTAGFWVVYQSICILEKEQK